MKFAIDVDVNKVLSLGQNLDEIDGQMLAEIGTQAVNEVADRAFALAKRRMLQGLNLNEAYVNRRITVRKAQVSARPRAVVTSAGDVTTLGHYGATVVTRSVKHPKRSKGNKPLGIPPGEKQGGVQVEVTRGNRKIVREGFDDVFRVAKFRDSDGNPLIFQRIKGSKNASGKEKLKVLYGPSVYQLFKYQIPLIRNEVEDDLEETIGQLAEQAIEGNL